MHHSPLPVNALAPADIPLQPQELYDFVANANVAMQALAADGTILWANRAQHEMLGYELDEYVGRNIAELHAEPAESAAILRHLATGQELQEQTVQLRCKDGSIKHALLRSTGCWHDGKLVHNRCFTLDATDRRRAAETQALLAAIVTASDDAIVSKTLDGVIRSWNRAAERLFGYTAEEAVGRRIELIIPPELRDEERSILARLRRGERIDHFETVRMTKDGRRIDISLTISPIYESGRIIGASKVARDISDRKLAQQALEASERRYRAIVDSQAEMICRFALDGTILFANAAYARARNAAPENLVGTNFWAFIPEPDRPTVRAQLASLTPERPEIKIENRFLAADGERWTLWTNRGLIFDAAGRIVEVQSTGIDITDRRRAEEALREADRRKNDFLATLGHELRNPLAPIRNMLEVLERADDDPELRTRARATMSRQMDVLVRLVDDLLDVARITRGKLQLRKQPIDLATVVREAVEDARHLIDEAGHDLVVQLPSEPVRLEADGVRLVQTLTNLLSNAAKYTPDGGRIELAAERGPLGVEIKVRDNGLGIPPDQLGAVFEMFEQVDHTLARGHKGLGIGLSLVKGLVEMHGGRVSARSAGFGKGSEFSVWLPTSADAGSRGPAQESAAPPEASAAARPTRRVLVVDDNRDAADSLAMLLRLHGHDARVAFDGIEALAAAAEFRPEVVFLDIGLPKLNGHDVARRLRAEPWGERAVIVAVTGWGQEADRAATRAAGCDLHVTKPLTLDKLHEALDRGGSP